MDLNKKITIFTPTYNRAHTLPKLYNSLLAQTNNDFIWLIIDDGSTDNTKKVIGGWKLENKINIDYYKTKNRGKSMAHNLAISLCKTDLFLCVDSDDYLANEKVVKEILDQNINDNKIIGISAIRGKNETIPIGGGWFPKKLVFSTLFNIYFKGNFKGEMVLVFKSKILKKFSYPDFNEKFVPDAFIYDQIDQFYQYKLLNKIMVIGDYLEDGYTQNIIRLKLNNPKGFMAFYKQRIKLNKSIKIKIKNMALFLISAKLNKESYIIKKSQNPVLAIVSIPLALIVYIVKYRKEYALFSKNKT